MAELLKPFGLKTNKNVRRGRRTAKGFHRANFEVSFSSYLVPTESQGSQGHKPVNSSSYEDHKGHTIGHTKGRTTGHSCQLRTRLTV